MRALDHLQIIDAAPEVIPNANGIDDIQHLLRLSFAFIEPPTEEHISDFVTDLAHMIKTSASPVKNVSWDMLAKRTKRISMQEAAWEVLRREQRRLSSLSTFRGRSPSGCNFGLLKPTEPSECGEGDSTIAADSPVPEQQRNSDKTLLCGIDSPANVALYRISPGDHEIEMDSKSSCQPSRPKGRWFSFVSMMLVVFVAGVWVFRIEDSWQLWEK